MATGFKREEAIRYIADTAVQFSVKLHDLEFQINARGAANMSHDALTLGSHALELDDLVFSTELQDGLQEMNDKGIKELCEKCKTLAGLYGLKTNNTNYDEKICSVSIVFIKSEQTITVNSKMSTGNTTSETFNASNNPSNFNAPQKKYTAPLSGEPKNYYPQKFPNGIWNIYDSRNGTSKFEGDNVLKTTAHQIVDVYEQNDDGEWIVCGQQDDSGYNIHDGKDDFADWMKVTDGCIRVETTTSKRIRSLLSEVKKSSGIMSLQVKD